MKRVLQQDTCVGSLNLGGKIINRSIERLMISPW